MLTSSFLRLTILLFLLSGTFFLACSLDEEEGTSIFTSTDCTPADLQQLIGLWTDPIFFSGEPSCADTLCLEFELDLRADSTYRLDYELFYQTTDTLYLAARHDSGTYLFNCQSAGVFTQRFLFEYVTGQLIFFPDQAPGDTLGIRWDGLYGLQIPAAQFHPSFLGTLLLQKD